MKTQPAATDGNTLNGPESSGAAHGSVDGDIRCSNCFKLFNVMKAETGWRTLPNTLTDLEDRYNVWITCPHCNVTM